MENNTKRKRSLPETRTCHQNPPPGERRHRLLPKGRICQGEAPSALGQEAKFVHSTSGQRGERARAMKKETERDTALCFSPLLPFSHISYVFKIVSFLLFFFLFFRGFLFKGKKETYGAPSEMYESVWRFRRVLGSLVWGRWKVFLELSDGF